MSFADKHIGTVLFAGVFAVLLSFASTTSAIASELDDAEAAAEAAKAEYDTAIEEYEQASDDLDYITAQVEESQIRVGANREKTAEAARFLYRAGGDKLPMILEIIVSGKDLATIIAELDAYNSVYDYNADLLDRELKAMEQLQQQRAQQEQAVEELAAKKDQLEEALDEALAAYEALKPAPTSTSSSSSSGVVGDVPSEVTISVDQLLFLGVVYANGYRYTFYQEHVLPGGGLSIPGRHHEDGMICDGDGYICVASNDLPKGTVVPTPLGRAGKVYDSGCASGTIDLYLV